MKIHEYTWADFDDALSRVTKPVCDSLCPIPRGGLVFAVALSHKFNLPLVTRPTSTSILVDDIADSGKTLQEWKLLWHNCPSLVLLRRSSCSPIGITALDVIDNNDWVVFPWENKQKAEEDYEHYIASK